jgi:hypothetical protein
VPIHHVIQTYKRQEWVRVRVLSSMQLPHSQGTFWANLAISNSQSGNSFLMNAHRIFAIAQNFHSSFHTASDKSLETEELFGFSPRHVFKEGKILQLRSVERILGSEDKCMCNFLHQKPTFSRHSVGPAMAIRLVFLGELPIYKI